MLLTNNRDISIVNVGLLIVCATSLSTIYQDITSDYYYTIGSPPSWGNRIERNGQYSIQPVRSFTTYYKVASPLYFGFSAHLSLVASVSHWLRTGLFTTRKLLSSLAIVNLSSVVSLSETCPSIDTVVPSFTCTPTTPTVLSALTTIGLKLKE